MKNLSVILLAFFLFNGCSKKPESSLKVLNENYSIETIDGRWRLLYGERENRQLVTEGILEDGYIVTFFESPIIQQNNSGDIVRTKQIVDFDRKNDAMHIEIVAGQGCSLNGGQELPDEKFKYVIDRMEQALDRPDGLDYIITIYEPVDRLYFEHILAMTLGKNSRVFIAVDFEKKIPKKSRISLESKNDEPAAVVKHTDFP